MLLIVDITKVGRSHGPGNGHTDNSLVHFSLWLLYGVIAAAIRRKLHCTTIHCHVPQPDLKKLSLPEVNFGCTVF